MKRLENQGNPLPSPDARRSESVALSAPAEFIKEVHRNPRSARREGVTHCYRPAVDVEFIARNPEILLDRQRLGRKRLVDLYEIYLIELHPGSGERLFRRRNRTDARDLGIAARNPI